MEGFDPARAPDPKVGSKPGAGSRWDRTLTVAGIALLSLSLVAGCTAANGASEESSGMKVELLRADSSLRAPTWVPKEGGKEAFLEVPEKGIEPAFYVVHPGGVEFYSGFPPEHQVGKRIGVEEEAFTLDDDAAERVYVGEPSGEVDLIEGDPQHELEGKLLVEKKVDLGEPAQYLESRIAEELLVYAATESKVVAIKYDTMQIVGSVDFRDYLKQKSLRDAKVSGMSVGEKRIYLTLEGEPYVLSIRKPS